MPPKIRDVIAALEAAGWRQTGQKGSHRQFEHPARAGKVTIAGKPSKDVPPGTLASIRQQAGLPSLGRPPQAAPRPGRRSGGDPRAE